MSIVEASAVIIAVTLVLQALLFMTIIIFGIVAIKKILTFVKKGEQKVEQVADEVIGLISDTRNGFHKILDSIDVIRLVKKFWKKKT